jgi:hypothetical protein
MRDIIHRTKPRYPGIQKNVENASKWEECESGRMLMNSVVRDSKLFAAKDRKEYMDIEGREKGLKNLTKQHDFRVSRN